MQRGSNTKFYHSFSHTLFSSSRTLIIYRCQCDPILRRRPRDVSNFGQSITRILFLRLSSSFKKKSFELRVFVVSIASLSTELSPPIYHYFQFLFEYLWHMTDTLKIRNRDNRYVCEPFYIGVRLCNRNIRDVSR